MVPRMKSAARAARSTYLGSFSSLPATARPVKMNFWIASSIEDSRADFFDWLFWAATDSAMTIVRMSPAAPILAGKRILVTGGTGFIGRNLIAELLKREGDIHLLVREGSQGKQLIAEIFRRWDGKLCSFKQAKVLRKYGYPPDLQEEAVKTVLAQAELLCAEWV